MAKDKNRPSNEQLNLLGDQNLVSRAGTPQEIRQHFQALDGCLKPPALLPDEKTDDFDILFNELLRSVAPMDAIEYIYTRDVAILTFEINRLQRHKVDIVKAAQPDAVNRLLNVAVSRLNPHDVSRGWALGDAQATSQVNDVLKKRGLKREAITAKAIELKLNELQKLEEMVARHEGRRFAIFREIDRRRDGFKRRLQEAVKNTDGSYSIIDPEPDFKSKNGSILRPSQTERPNNEDPNEDDVHFEGEARRHPSPSPKKLS